MSREAHVRISEGVGVRFPGATRLLNLHHEKMTRLFTCHVGTFLVDCFLPASIGTDLSSLVPLAQENHDLPQFPDNLLRGKCLLLHPTSLSSWSSDSKLIFELIFGGQVTIETAKAYEPEPYLYLRFLFEKLPFAQALEDYEALLPQKMTPDPIPLATAVV